MRQPNYDEASKSFDAAEKKYKKLGEFQAAAVERQTKELEAGDSAKAAESAAVIEKLGARLAEQKEKLAEAKRVKQEAYIRENPTTPQEIEKAAGISPMIKVPMRSSVPKN